VKPGFSVSIHPRLPACEYLLGELARRPAADTFPSYELNDGYFPCKYLSDNGQVYGNSDVKCPAQVRAVSAVPSGMTLIWQADQGGCGTMPNNGFRKRSAPKKLTPLEELVASRQYDPKAHTGTVPLGEQEAAARFVLAE